SRAARPAPSRMRRPRRAGGHPRMTTRRVSLARADDLDDLVGPRRLPGASRPFLAAPADASVTVNGAKATPPGAWARGDARARGRHCPETFHRRPTSHPRPFLPCRAHATTGPAGLDLARRRGRGQLWTAAELQEPPLHRVPTRVHTRVWGRWANGRSSRREAGTPPRSRPA